MRNLSQYPMTHKEAISLLTRIKESFDPNLIGDLRPYAIDWVIKALEEHKVYQAKEARDQQWYEAYSKQSQEDFARNQPDG